MLRAKNLHLEGTMQFGYNTGDPGDADPREEGRAAAAWGTISGSTRVSVLAPRGASFDESRRRRGCDVDIRSTALRSRPARASGTSRKTTT